MRLEADRFPAPQKIIRLASASAATYALKLQHGPGCFPVLQTSRQHKAAA
jgi:hypothetical protein